MASDDVCRARTRSILPFSSTESMIPIEVERQANVVTVATDTRKRMYAVVHLAVPAGFDPSDFTLSRVGPQTWELAFDSVATAHRFKRLLEEASQLITQPVKPGGGPSIGITSS